MAAQERILTPSETEKPQLEEPVDRNGAAAGGEADTEELPLLSRRRVLETLAVVVALVIAIYFLFPKLVGLGDAADKLGDAKAGWIVVAIAFAFAAFGTYIALFRGVVGGDVLPLRWREAYEINMAGFAATRLFSAAGTGGIVLTYWALRKAGMERRQSGQRMVAFMALHYLFYPLALIVFGVLLRTGVLSGKASVELTILPAAIAGVALLVGLAVALVPKDFDRRAARFANGPRRAALAARIAAAPATFGAGIRLALELVTNVSRGGLALVGAIGFWAANIGILWASFKAYGVHVPLGVVIQGFFIGMAANLLPISPAGVGAVDAGMIGVFVLFGLPDSSVFAAVLTYRLIAFWMPIPPGIVAFFQLRGTVQRWREEGLPADRSTAKTQPQPAPS